MKKNVIRLFTLVMFFSFFVKTSYSQLNDMSDMIKGSIADAEKLGKAYITPFAKALGYDLNAGWYNTGKAHGLLGFDITISACMATVPDVDKTYDIRGIGLSNNFSLVDQNKYMAPTAAGAEGDGPQLQYMSGSNQIQFATPGGTGMSFIPAPMIKAGVGLVKNTELLMRFVPKLKIGDAGSIGLWGLGIKHDILQWLPIVDKVPFLNVSAVIAYTSLSASTDLNATIGGSNQSFDMKVNSFMFNIAASVDIPFITVYTGFGLSSSNSTFKLLGNYVYSDFDGNQVSIKDPVNIEINNSGNFNFTAGLKLKLGFFHLFADYTFSKYKVLNAGLAFSFR